LAEFLKGWNRPKGLLSRPAGALSTPQAS